MSEQEMPDGLEYTGAAKFSVASERKPTMDKDKRKVLNLLEFLSELSPSQRVCQIMVNATPVEVYNRLDGDLFYITDAEMAGYLQSYADLVSEYRKTHDDSGGH